MVSIQIGPVTIDDVEILPYGVVRKIGSRARLRDTSAQEEIWAITSKSLRHLVVLIYNIQHSGYQIGRLDRPVLVEYCQEFLRCSRRTAYNYAKAIQWICVLLNVV